MRKILYSLVLLFCLVLTSCNDNVKVGGYDYNETIFQDSALVAQLSGSNEVKFFEAQARLNKPLNKEDKEYDVEWMMSVFQADTLVYLIEHPLEEYGSEPIVRKYNDIWIGDMISPIAVKVDVADAIKAIRKSDVDAPESPLFVLRRPLAPPFPKHKYYLFGSSTAGVIKVNSETGSVTYLNETDEEYVDFVKSVEAYKALDTDTIK